jgi:hypothetical protein
MTRYQSGKVYLVSRRNLKLWGIYKCKWRNRSGCKGCPGQLKFKELKGLKCGYIAGGKPMYRRISRQNDRNHAHVAPRLAIGKGGL